MLTPSQQRAVAAQGNVLVKAGAGTGKTRTLVDRCLARLTDPMAPVSLDHILMVTFTEAAAAEIRRRLREALEKLALANPQSSWLEEQLALVDTALISTLHSFCLQLVREHFYELGLDPQLTVLADEQARLLAAGTLDKLLQRHYAGTTPAAESVRNLVAEHGRGWDRPVRELVLRLHHYTQTLTDPSGWFQGELRAAHQPAPLDWAQWLQDGFQEWRQSWRPVLEGLPAENLPGRSCAEVMQAIPNSPTRIQIATGLAAILAADANWPLKRKMALRAPIEKLFQEAAFLYSVARLGSPRPAGSAESQPEVTDDPLAEDWNWVRPLNLALLQLTQDFTAEFGRAKRELGALDFHDLEQFALRLLWDPKANAPTAIARHWRARLWLLFVDEYQDINEAQDAILTALGREGGEANRFLVGDVKQSIYRFRLANPHIFQAYASRWREQPALGTVISLSDNFRSRETLLQFVNALFAGLMQPEVGGVAYDEEARLRFGAPAERADGAARAGRSARHAPDESGESPPHVELHLLLTGNSGATETGGDAADSPPPAGLGELSTIEQEARLVARRLQELQRQHLPVWDKAAECRRPVEWRDMVVLLRSPRFKAESFAKEFARLGIPLLAARSGFYQCTEVTDLLNLLRLLDNPLQDLPLLAVLRSPLVGLTLDELATIRLAHRQGYYWTALQRFQQESGASAAGADLWRTTARFLERYSRWRTWARQRPLSQCLETILDETDYEARLVVQPRGAQRQANVQRLLVMTRQFDQFQRQGLYRFLKLVEAQLEAELDKEPAPIGAANAVRLMSIHQSKGLEFPIVAVACLGSRFNFADLRAPIILDEQYGLCPLVKPPEARQRYPSLPYWLARRRQKRELLGEELRLLYVALTRACDQLILSGSVTRKTAAETWAREASERPSPRQILSGQSPLDWLGRWLSGATGHQDWTVAGRSTLLAWIVCSEADLAEVSCQATVTAPVPNTGLPSAGPEQLAALRQRLSWTYPYAIATREPAKTSVSALRRRANEEDEEAQPFFEFSVPRPWLAAPARETETTLSAAEIGTGHHTFLQWVPLQRTGNLAELQQQADLLEKSGLLSAAERQVLDLPALVGFWQGELGRRIRAHAPCVRRELPFTARFSLGDLARLKIGPLDLLSEEACAPRLAGPTQSDPSAKSPETEFVVVQGVIDLAVILPKEIWILDYKTDRLRPNDLAEKVRTYRPQLALYALALSRIYQLPVTERWLHFITLRTSAAVEGV